MVEPHGRGGVARPQGARCGILPEGCFRSRRCYRGGVSDMLVPFVFELRKRKLKVGPMELNALAEALTAMLRPRRFS